MGLAVDVMANQTLKNSNMRLETSAGTVKTFIKIWSYRYAYLLIIPGVLFFIIYRYIPMLGNVIAFQDYSPFLGFTGSEWVGLRHFKTIFEDPEVVRVLFNTLTFSFLQIVFAFPAPIILSLMLNEVRREFAKRFIQSVVYLPHFLSWVIVVGITMIFFRNDGIINNFMGTYFGYDLVHYLTEPALFKPMVIFQVIWKEVGWGTIIFLAAIAGIDPNLYEAAVVDGAGRWRKLWHITLPAMRSVIAILLILRLGDVLDTGFEHIFLMLNPFNMEQGNVLDTYVYFKGIQQGDYSFATAVGLFKGLIGMILIIGANKLSKKLGEEGIF
jgi:putative aldouronate transport system permease protein